MRARARETSSRGVVIFGAIARGAILILVRHTRDKFRHDPSDPPPAAGEKKMGTEDRWPQIAAD